MKRIDLKKIKETKNPNPSLNWWVTKEVEEEVLIEKFTSRWGVPPRYYQKMKDGLIRLGPVPD